MLNILITFRVIIVFQLLKLVQCSLCVFNSGELVERTQKQNRKVYEVSVFWLNYQQGGNGCRDVLVKHLIFGSGFPFVIDGCQSRESTLIRYFCYIFLFLTLFTLSKFGPFQHNWFFIVNWLFEGLNFLALFLFFVQLVPDDIFGIWEVYLLLVVFFECAVGVVCNWALLLFLLDVHNELCSIERLIFSPSSQFSSVLKL